MKKNLVLILAGGSGSRIAGDLPKQFFMLEDKMIFRHTIDKFENHPDIHHIFIVTNGDHYDRTVEMVETAGYKKVIKILKGGKTRQESSRIGVMAAGVGEYDNVLIHDAARPFVSRQIIDDVLEALETYAAVNVGIPSADTVVEIDDDNVIKKVPDRKYLRRVQTPQAFKYEAIRKAHLAALENDITNATDDCSLILNLTSHPIYVVEGSQTNIKITYPIDLHIAQKIMEAPGDGNGDG